MTPSAAPQQYWLGDSPPEVDHLLAQAEFLGHDAAELLNRIGVGPGTSVIDIGCGVLGILPQLRSRVGNDGRVVGLDIEPRLLAVADQLSARHGLAAETVRPDAGLPSGCFDIAHERMLLLIVTSPHDVVAEMARLAGPGGIVALQEPDRAAWAIDPLHPAWDVLLAEVTDVYLRTGRDFHTGRRAAHLIREADLQDIQVRVLGRLTARRILPYVPAHPGRPHARGDPLQRPAHARPARLPRRRATRASQPAGYAHLPADHLAGLGPQTRRHRTRPRTAPPGRTRPDTNPTLPSELTASAVWTPKWEICATSQAQGNRSEMRRVGDPV